MAVYEPPSGRRIRDVNPPTREDRTLASSLTWLIAALVIIGSLAFYNFSYTSNDAHVAQSTVQQSQPAATP